METKIAYQTNEQGIYVGEVHRQPSPLEPGVWLVPGGAVLVAPPEIPEGQQAKWNGEGWDLETIPVVEEVPVEESQAPVEAPEEGMSTQSVKQPKKKAVK